VNDPVAEAPELSPSELVELPEGANIPRSAGRFIKDTHVAARSGRDDEGTRFGLVDVRQLRLVPL
jgi:hypothetical protein